MKELESSREVLVTQKKEMFEAFTGFETQNNYVVRLQNGQTLYAAEVNTGFLSRNFLKQLRPFELVIADEQRNIRLRVNRHFRFMFHEITVSNSHGMVLGRVVKRFTFLNRLYDVKDADDRTLFELKGPLFKPWTFRIENALGNVGVITKKWSGLFKEAMTDADNFGLKLEKDLPADQKAVLLGAVFLIDFVHFENNTSNGLGIDG
ncbi:phospholipid scramblase-related protein [Desulfoluna sp.]|uniref:phospholipid scramblase-related protein n=1 Tax=Desulfoluna sp. TaxID=2045199 RepID=UPI00261B594E|nr:phospholipid scramblase-related protein [Desulfoluna sp.]